MTKEESRRYYLKHRESIIAKNKVRNVKAYRENPEVRKKILERYHKNSSRILTKMAAERKKNPQRFQAINLKYQCKAAGITVEQYNSLPKICSNSGCKSINPVGFSKRQLTSWPKDHDHKTGKFRGLLCMDCNIALGLLKDDKNKIAGLLLYLEQHSV